MKRSEINTYIKEAKVFFDKFGFKLPEWAEWTPEDWKNKGHECDEIRRNALGWDITDFSKGHFLQEGLTLITLRNGNPAYDKKCYCEKIMMVRVDQYTPYHFHWHKQEDIINRGGGLLCMKLYNATKEEALDKETPVKIQIDGITHVVKPGETLKLAPGSSVTYTPYIYHTFWAEGEPALVGEVSMVNDDSTDNRFLEPLGRYPEVIEDEAPYRLLCNEYPAAK